MRKSLSLLAAAAVLSTAGIAQVTVTGLGGTSSTDGTGNDYRYFAIPAVSSLAPASGTVASTVRPCCASSRLRWAGRRRCCCARATTSQGLADERHPRPHRRAAR